MRYHRNYNVMLGTDFLYMHILRWLADCTGLPSMLMFSYLFSCNFVFYSCFSILVFVFVGGLISSLFSPFLFIISSWGSRLHYSSSFGQYRSMFVQLGILGHVAQVHACGMNRLCPTLDMNQFYVSVVLYIKCYFVLKA